MKIYKILFVIILISISFNLSSVAQNSWWTPDSKIYIPSRINSSLFKEPGFDLSVSAGTSGLESQFGMSPMKNFAFFIDGGVSVPFNVSPEFYAHTHIIGDIGVGYYHIFKKKIVLDLYGGYGQGFSSSSSTDFDVTSNYHRIFIQSGFGIISKKTEFGLSLRINTLYADVSGNTGTFVKMPYTAYNTPECIIEPKVDFKFGRPNIKFIMQTGVSMDAGFYFFFRTTIRINIISLFFSQ
jgi:hypothetical protein